MVLRRVGKRVVDVLVNGTQVDSFEQTGERADYDVSVSDNAETITRATTSIFEIAGGDFGKLLAAEDTPTWRTNTEAYSRERQPDEIRILAEEKSFQNTSVSVSVYDTEVNRIVEAGPGTGTQDTGWISRPASGFGPTYIYNEASSSEAISFELKERYTVTSGFSVDGATQS